MGGLETMWDHVTARVRLERRGEEGLEKRMEVWKGESNGREGESVCDEVTAGPRRRGGL